MRSGSSAAALARAGALGRRGVGGWRRGREAAGVAGGARGGRAVPSERRRRGSGGDGARAAGSTGAVVGGPGPRRRWARGQVNCPDPPTQPQTERQRFLVRWGGAAKPQLGKMFNVESVERVELCESLLTWVCDDWRVGGRPPPPASFPGSPTLVAGGERRGRRCRHIRGPGRAEPGDAGAGRVYPAAWPGRGRRGAARRGGLSPESERNLPGLTCWLLSEWKPARWRLMMGCRRHCD